MGEVRRLPLKCPLCDGAGLINGPTGDSAAPIEAYQCGMCKGTGKRPTDEELAQRRAANQGDERA